MSTGTWKSDPGGSQCWNLGNPALDVRNQSDFLNCQFITHTENNRSNNIKYHVISDILVLKIHSEKY